MKLRTSNNRFEIDVDGATVFADYRQDGDTISILHVETPQQLRGQGAAGKLMQEVTDYAGAQNLKIIPICGYAVAWMKRHKL